MLMPVANDGTEMNETGRQGSHLMPDLCIGTVSSSNPQGACRYRKAVLLSRSYWKLVGLGKILLRCAAASKRYLPRASPDSVSSV